MKMILSVSRRTDIPAFYSEWFCNRLKDGFVHIQNPMNANQISEVKLSPGIVDCIVFWTKNPKPLMERLDYIDSLGYKYYFQFTITPYDNSIEKGLGNKREIINTFNILSEKIGKEKVIWRYDPIIINEQFTIEFHVRSFEQMAKKVANYTNECIISFVDPYRKTKANMKGIFLREVTENEMNIIADEFSQIAKKHNLILKTCAEKIDLDKYGIEHASCIDRNKIEKIIKCKLKSTLKKDAQRMECGCVECIDIGAYNTCKNGCIYCYATVNENSVISNVSKHDPFSPLFIRNDSPNCKVTERKTDSFKILQETFDDI
jgi:hypothetical protein